MTLASLLLVVFASVIHAAWNLLAKRAASIGPVFVLAYNLVACVGYAPWGLYLLSRETIVRPAEGVGFVVLSSLVHLAYSLCLQRGYQMADLSVVYPVARGTGPMLSTIGAIVLLGEVPTERNLGGLVLVLIGIGLIATRGDFSAFRQPGSQTGIKWGTATGGLIASYTVVDAYTVKTLGVAPVLLDWFSNLLRACLLALMIGSNPRQIFLIMREHWWLAVGVGLLSPLSYILILAALQNGAPLSLVAPMREMSMMVGALLAMAILREVVGFWRLAGCGVLIAGVVVLASV